MWAHGSSTTHSDVRSAHRTIWRKSCVRLKPSVSSATRRCLRTALTGKQLLIVLMPTSELEGCILTKKFSDGITTMPDSLG